LTAPVSEVALVVVTVSVEVTAVPPFVVTGEGAVQVVAVNGETGVQVKVMFEPTVPSRLRVTLPEPFVERVRLLGDGVTEKSETPVRALTKVPTSNDPRPVTRS
jgi:hypothetical protein